jgi:hypothetical protein
MLLDAIAVKLHSPHQEVWIVGESQNHCREMHMHLALMTQMHEREHITFTTLDSHLMRDFDLKTMQPRLGNIRVLFDHYTIRRHLNVLLTELTRYDP